MGTPPLGWDKATEKGVGKEERAQTRAWPHDSKASAISVPPQSRLCPQLGPACHSHYTGARGHSESCLLLQNSEHETAVRQLSSLRCLEIPSPTPRGLGTFSFTVKALKLAVVDEPSDQPELGEVRGSAESASEPFEP